MTCFALFDCETTGIRPTDKIVELAYIAFNENFEELFRGQSLIDPEIPIPSGASAVNGITNDMVENEPTIEQFMLMNKQPLLVENAVLVAFNSSFDARYIGPWMVPDFKQMCTMRLAKKIYPGLDSYKLNALRYSLNLLTPEGDAHRAMFDVEMMLSLVQHMTLTTGLDLHGLLALAGAPVEITTWGFGKYKGKKINMNDPEQLGYANWYLKQDNKDADLVATLTGLMAK